MLIALQRAADIGEFIIPTNNPKAMRLDFQGLRGALRAENRGELADMVSFHIRENPPAFIIRLRDTSQAAQDIQAALSKAPIVSALEAADDALDRILAGGKNAV